MRATRSAAEALATGLEAMLHDTQVVAAELQATARSTRGFISALGADAPAAEADEDVSVMLGSASRWRRALVGTLLPDGLVLADEAVTPDIDEKAIRSEDARDLVTQLAHAKADEVLRKLKARGPQHTQGPDLVICADQVIVYGKDEIREKPVSEVQAKEHLQSYGRNRIPARCVNGVVVVVLRDGERFSGVNEALQYFRDIPDEVADAIVKKGDVMYSAGSFVVEDPLIRPYLDRRTGELEAVQGMPRALTRELLGKGAEHVRRLRASSAVKRAKLG